MEAAYQTQGLEHEGLNGKDNPVLPKVSSAIKEEEKFQDFLQDRPNDIRKEASGYPICKKDCGHEKCHEPDRKRVS